MYKVNINQLVPMMYIEWEINAGIAILRADIVTKKDKAHPQNKTVKSIFCPKRFNFQSLSCSDKYIGIACQIKCDNKE